MEAADLQLLNLPKPILAHVPSFLSTDEHLKDLASALLACKQLWQAGDEASYSGWLGIRSRVLRRMQRATASRVQQGIISCMARRGVYNMMVVWEHQADLQQVLTSLDPADWASGLHMLVLAPPWEHRQVRLPFAFGVPLLLPQGLGRLTALTNLRVKFPRQLGQLPASDLAMLASLTALKYMSIEAYVEGPAFPPFLSSMGKLINLDLQLKQPGDKTVPPRQLDLGACTELRHLMMCECCPCSGWPADASGMTQLWHLEIDYCGLTELSPELSALPAIKELLLGHNRLTDMPHLACIGVLQVVDLVANNFSKIPAVLGGGAASSLECLLLHGNNVDYGHLDDGEVALLETLTALQRLSMEGEPSALVNREEGVGEHLRRAARRSQLW